MTLLTFTDASPKSPSSCYKVCGLTSPSHVPHGCSHLIWVRFLTMWCPDWLHHYGGVAAFDDSLYRLSHGTMSGDWVKIIFSNLFTFTLWLIEMISWFVTTCSCRPFTHLLQFYPESAGTPRLQQLQPPPAASPQWPQDFFQVSREHSPSRVSWVILEASSQRDNRSGRFSRRHLEVEKQQLELNPPTEESAAASFFRQ